MTSKVEIHCQTMRCKTISVNPNDPVCINCEWYEQHYRQSRGNVAHWVAIDSGYCLLKQKACNPLRRACKQKERD